MIHLSSRKGKLLFAIKSLQQAIFSVCDKKEHDAVCCKKYAASHLVDKIYDELHGTWGLDPMEQCFRADGRCSDLDIPVEDFCVTCLAFEVGS